MKTILFLLTVIGVFLLFAESEDVTIFVMSKAAGFALTFFSASAYSLISTKNRRRSWTI